MSIGRIVRTNRNADGTCIYRNTMAIAALMKTGGIPEAPRGIGRSRDPGAHYCAAQQRTDIIIIYLFLLQLTSVACV